MKRTRKCAYCGKEFTLNSGSQKYCCESCAEAAKRERKKKVSDFIRAVEPVAEVSRQEYLTFAKAAVLMGCSRQYIYKLVSNGKLPASRLSSRMSFVRRADIETLISGSPYYRVLPFSQGRKDSESAVSRTSSRNGSDSSNSPKNKINGKVSFPYYNKVKGTSPKANVSPTKTPQTDEPMEYYSGAEVMEKFKVKQSWLYVCAKRARIPTCKISGRTYYEKRAIDEHFGVAVDVSSIEEWMTMDEVIELFKMAKTAVRSYAHRHSIPTKREFGVTYYSKKHFEELRRTDLTDDERYTTVEEIAKRYGMTTSNVCVIIKKSGVERIKVGVKNLVLREEIEKVMAKREYGAVSQSTIKKQEKRVI